MRAVACRYLYPEEHHILQELSVKERRERRAVAHLVDEGPFIADPTSSMVVSVLEHKQHKNKGEGAGKGRRRRRTLRSRAPPCCEGRAAGAHLAACCSALCAGFVPPYHKDSKFYGFLNFLGSKNNLEEAAAVPGHANGKPPDTTARNPVLAHLDQEMARQPGHAPPPPGGAAASSSANGAGRSTSSQSGQVMLAAAAAQGSGGGAPPSRSK